MGPPELAAVEQGAVPKLLLDAEQADYSDVKDTGTFLKEHGAKPKEKEPKREVGAPADKAALLAKLEQRFIMGEISESAYERLVEKYSEED